jgi:hypothetical protein
MPDTPLSGAGFRGMSLPQADLLWETAFGLRFGLFTSSPLLLLALVPTVWRRRDGGLLPRRELAFVLAFCALLLLFAAANQYGRMQFNSGVRHVVPAAPFLFLLAAGTLLRLPRAVATVFAAAALYWSWCLAMYRDVEQGLGVLEPVLQISRGGPQLPWLTTLARMGYLQQPPVVPILLAAALVVALLWTVGGGARLRRIPA